jgi:ketosteroid isomerase-like protein
METSMSSEEIQELRDRQAISALLLDFAHCLDTKDWQGYSNNFCDDGVLTIPASNVNFKKDELADSVSKSLGRYAQTMHFSTNHRITISGDTARSRSYMLAIHIFDLNEPDRHADSGGWYDCDYVRTPDGWKFQHVLTTRKWSAGDSKL